MSKNLLFDKQDYEEESVFKPENLLREARRQKSLPECEIPDICLLEPDGDIVTYLNRSGRASVNRCWAGYHTTMHEFELGGRTVGIIGQAVGASFAVLVAEQMFASGCELLVSITSAGTITPPPDGKQFILIEEALRDEGTSCHYLPPGKPALLNRELLENMKPLRSHPELSVGIGKSWTTDAPYRETASAIEYAERQQVNAVEMEAAALYAFAEYRQQQVVCFAHLTNTMARETGDFEKGLENGSIASLKLIEKVIENINR
ncbi:nucleoside phosphorylase [Halalkalibaculum sp. DA384]|uniref:nucleoside phosphorylase n=1 Tax=Halalkalibaculum sp. DA384 TaxID=3373606 RepID=UPI003754DF13